MLNIKIILLIPLFLLIIAVIPKIGERTFYRLTLLGISTVGIVFILFPKLTDKIAMFVGVERGSFLITYLAIIFFFLAGIILYSKMRKLEADQAELVRKIAIQRAEKIS